MRNIRLLPIVLGAVTSGQALAQPVEQSGSIGGLNYLLMTGSCSASAPCQIVTYLHYLGGAPSTADDLRKYFGPSFWAQNPNTVVLAPLIANSSATNNWGGVSEGVSPNMQAAVDLVKQVEATVPTNPNTVVVTGGSMGGIGTEAAMLQFGPKGTTGQHVFAAGLAYDGAIYPQSEIAAATTALCGVPFTMVHGAQDTTVPFGVDQSLASQLSGCAGFNFVPVAGVAHGTWNYGPAGGYAAGTLIDQTLATARQVPTATAVASTGSAAVSTATAAFATTAAQTAPLLIESATVTPGNGSITDSNGHVWTITASGSIMEDNQYTPGGGGTSALTILDGLVYGQDSGRGPVNPGGWFTLSANGQNWQVSAAPGSSVATAPTVPTAPTGSCDTTAATSSGFRVSGGQIIGPHGPFIGRGINVSDRNLGDADKMLAMFPGLNFVRVAVYSYQDPSFYGAFIATMTAHGTVVELEHHVETNGATGGGGQGGIASGGWLAQESAFYAAVAAAYKSNPYVWFGTTNEPPGQSGLSAWQKATYSAIRGTGNTSIILLEISGWPGGWTNALDPSAYAQMTNVVWDPHFYGWVSRYSTDQATIDKALADMIASIQTITSADGKIPAMVAEYGPSTTGMSLDANGMQTVDSVINRGGNGETGSAVWHWGEQDCCNNLNNGSSLTDLGQKVQLFINTDVVPPTPCQQAATAQSTVTQITAQVAAETPAMPSSEPTQTAVATTAATDPSIQGQIDAADAAIAQANAILAKIKAQ